MGKISKYQAYKLAKKCGIRFGLKDSDRQDMSAMSKLASISKLAGYRKGKYASGSTARYFFYHLLRLKKKHNWK